jgi:hypothetical protein
VRRYAADSSLFASTRRNASGLPWSVAATTVRGTRWLSGEARECQCRTVAAWLQHSLDRVAHQRRHFRRVPARAEHDERLGGPMGALDDSAQLLQQEAGPRRAELAAPRNKRGQVGLERVGQRGARRAQHVAELGQLAAQLHLVVVHERLVHHHNHRLAEPQRLGDRARASVPNDQIRGLHVVAQRGFVSEPLDARLSPRARRRRLVLPGTDLQRDAVVAVPTQSAKDTRRVDGHDQIVELRAAHSDKHRRHSNLAQR